MCVTGKQNGSLHIIVHLARVLVEGLFSDEWTEGPCLQGPEERINKQPNHKEGKAVQKGTIQNKETQDEALRC